MGERLGIGDCVARSVLALPTGSRWLGACGRLSPSGDIFTLAMPDYFVPAGGQAAERPQA